jgi:hypothetical protein
LFGYGNIFGGLGDSFVGKMTRNFGPFCRSRKNLPKTLQLSHTVAYATYGSDSDLSSTLATPSLVGALNSKLNQKIMKIIETRIRGLVCALQEIYAETIKCYGSTFYCYDTNKNGEQVPIRKHGEFSEVTSVFMSLCIYPLDGQPPLLFSWKFDSYVSFEIIALKHAF